MSIYSINFNNQNSYTDIGLFIESKPNPPIAEKNINIIDVDGMNGDLIEDIDTYKSIEIAIKFILIEPLKFNETVRKIKAWLQNIDDNKLVLLDDTNYFYNVEYVKFDANITRELDILGSFTATFVCKPFSYSFSGLNSITVANNSTIINEGTYKSITVINITGSGTIQLYINNRELIINNLSSNITINSVLQESYDSNYANLNGSIDGDYPYLDVGKNTIIWTGNITKLTIQPNWCFL